MDYYSIEPIYSLVSLRRDSECAANHLLSLVEAIEGRLEAENKLVVVPYDWYSPADVLAAYLRDGFHKLELVFEHLKRINPDEVVRELGERIASAMARLYKLLRKRIAKSLVGSIERKLSFVIDLTTPGSLARHSLRRKAILDRIIDSLRCFFVNVRDAFRLVELSLPRALPPITLGAYARTFVHEVNYEKKYLILSEEGGGLHLYNLSPPKVWAILRTLLETDDPRGWVRLPEHFRSQFSTKDASGNRVKDDLWRLSLHIHSAQNGEYYLSPHTRTPQKWDR